MKITYYSIVIGILLLCNGVILYRFNKKEEEHTKEITKLKKESKEYKYEILKESSLHQIKSEAIKLKPVILLEPATGNNIKLSDLISGPKLILRYSELNCDVCVNQEVKNLKNLEKEIGRENIIIIASYNDPKHLNLFRRINQVEAEIYNIGEGKLNIPLETANAPFLFVLDPSLITKTVFMPSKEIPEMSETYYKLIISKFFKK